MSSPSRPRRLGAPVLCLILVGTLSGAPAGATSAAASPAQHPGAVLAAQKACLGCHDVQRRKVGPSFRAIAERYATQAGAAEALAVKIRQGSRGAWGVVAMPANPSITAEEARVMAEWVLGQR